MNLCKDCYEKVPGFKFSDLIQSSMDVLRCEVCGHIATHKIQATILMGDVLNKLVPILVGANHSGRHL